MEFQPRAAVTAAIAAAILAATAVAAAGCKVSPNAAPSPGSPSASAGRTAGTGPAGQPPPASGDAGGGKAGSRSLSRCHTSMLSASVVPGQPGAGQRYADLVLTNTSGVACRVYGYPGMQLVSASGGPIPTAVERQPGTAPLVMLAPGQRASSLLHWTIVPGIGEGTPCEPTAAGLSVIPPDETAPLHTSWPGGPVCQHGQIFTTTFQPGANASPV
jgi:hypothetical protein